MKQTEAQGQFEAGQIVMKGKYWGGRLEQRTFRDKTSGSRKTGHILHHTVMGANSPVVVSRWLQDDEKPEAVTFPIKQMTPVLVVITSMEVNNGVPFVKGEVTALD